MYVYLWHPPRYNWNIVESGVKHRDPNPYLWKPDATMSTFRVLYL